MNKLRLPWLVLLLLNSLTSASAALPSPVTVVVHTEEQVSSMAWLTGWDYRKEITITNNVASDLTDFQVPVDLDTVADVEAGKVEVDFSDIRVTDSDGETLLDFYREYGAGEIDDETNWWRWPENPILRATAAAWDDRWVAPRTVIYDSGTYYLYYQGATAASPTVYKIGLATSSDGLSWTKEAGNPIIDVGAGGTWDDGAVTHLCVVKEGANWYGWYAGHDGSAKWKIGYATSSDGISWTKDGGNPIMSGTAAEWDSDFVVPSRVWKEGSTYYMVYWGGTIGDDSTTWDIGLATSTDRVAWTKEASNPVLEGVDGTWEDGLLDPDVIKIGSTYYMFYQGNTADQNSSAIGVATSADLTTWSKNANNPFTREGAWDLAWNEGPVLFKVGDTWHMYYMGQSGGVVSTGLMQFKQTRLWVKVPSIPSSGTATIYVYYGNAAVSDVSNGANTFPTFFEDFTGGTPFSQWTNAGSFTGSSDRGG